MSIAGHLAGIQFEHVLDIEPRRDAAGRICEETPHASYQNKGRLALHPYGAGPFCKFSIPGGWKGLPGVYVFLVDGDPKYVGECQNLAQRVNSGYGQIAPRNCYIGGQQTNCRINHLILEAAKRGNGVQLLFHETDSRHDIEAKLVATLSPEWNRARPQARPTRTTWTPGRERAPRRRMVESSTCRDAVLAAARTITTAKGRNDFTPSEIVEHLRRQGSPYPPSTIRTHVVSRLCANAPDHHATTYSDFERIDRGLYRIINATRPAAGRPSSPARRSAPGDASGFRSQRNRSPRTRSTHLLP